MKTFVSVGVCACSHIIHICIHLYCLPPSINLHARLYVLFVCGTVYASIYLFSHLSVWLPSYVPHRVCCCTSISPTCFSTRQRGQEFELSGRELGPMFGLEGYEKTDVPWPGVHVLEEMVLVVADSEFILGLPLDLSPSVATLFLAVCVELL